MFGEMNKFIVKLIKIPFEFLNKKLKLKISLLSLVGNLIHSQQ